MKSYTRILFLTAVSALAGSSYIGEAATTNFGLTGSVAASCTLTPSSTTSFDFGTSMIQPTGTNLGHFSGSSSGTLTIGGVNCNGGGSTLSLKTTNGALKTGTAACTAATCANYTATAQLSGGTGSTTLTTNGTANGTSTPVTIGAANGTITMTVGLNGSTGVPATPGSYSDTIVVTVTPA